jgi:transposase
MSVLATLLGNNAVVAPEPPEPLDTQPVREHERHKPTGRKPLPETLPRVEIEILPDQVQREGLDAFERIGEDVSETVG